MKKEDKIKEVQNKAKELGHCLCNFKITCPCPAFQQRGICACCEGY